MVLIKHIGFFEKYLQRICNVFANQIFGGCLVGSNESLKSGMRIINV